MNVISHGKEVKVFAGNSNRALAEAICDNLSKKLGTCKVSAFADGEVSLNLGEPVRGSDVFIVQSTCKPVNDNLMELLVMIDAMRRASAGRITAVMPYFGYARQDRKAKSRDPISAKLVANLITSAGADRVLTMDLHAAQIQGFFDIPVDNLFGAPILANHYIRQFGLGNEDFIVVSPDVGSVARARSFAQKLGMSLAIVDKRRQRANSSEVMNIIGDVAGKTSYCSTTWWTRPAALPRGRGPGEGRQGQGYLRLRQPRRPLRLGAGDHRCQPHQGADTARHHTLSRGQADARQDKYLSVASLFAEAIERIYEEVSISSLFD